MAKNGSRGGIDADKTAIHELPPLDAVKDERSAALICISGRSIGQMFLVSEDEMTLGRAPECDIFLDDEGVSRHHAKVIRQGDTLIMMDLGSTNGTYVEGERIQVLTLTDGIKIQVGTATILQFRYQDEREVEFHTLMQTFKTHDPMTDALNKRAFSVELDKEFGFARRHGEPLSLILFDLDHFKKVNDTYGHQAGDLVLRAVAKSVTETMRKEDVFARYGGEEFALLLRSTDLEAGFIVAERVRRGIEGMEVTHNGRRIPCTTSVGLAQMTDDMGRAEDLVEAADERLYQAKKRGRNRTESPLFD